MASNTIPPRPDWLTDERIEFYRNELRKCPDYLTDKELSDWIFDDTNDIQRANARRAYKILSNFGLLEEQEDKP